MKFRRRTRRIRYNRYSFQAIILTFIALFAYKASGSGGVLSLLENGFVTNTREVTSDLEVHFLDVGQGDCILLICEGKAMLIDAGDNDMGNTVVDYIQYQKIDRLDYVVATHPDADHIGGLDDVLNDISCGEVIMTDDKKDTKTYDEVVEIIEEKNIEKHAPQSGETFEFGCSTVTVLGPVTDNEDVNDNSIVLQVTHGEKTFLFSGDAQIEEMEQICDSGINLSSDVYKVSHHGSSNGVCESFLDSVNPKYAVISCGEDNSYGHPHQEILLYLRENNIALFRTDEQGTIVAVSDGEDITWNCSPSESWKGGDR